MTHVSPTITDISRAVADLDDNALTPDAAALEQMRRRIASNLAHRFRRAGMSPQKRTKGDVAMALIVHGASPLTVDQHANMIARYVRADWNS
jgi:hypothetical protein